MFFFTIAVQLLGEIFVLLSFFSYTLSVCFCSAQTKRPGTDFRNVFLTLIQSYITNTSLVMSAKQASDILVKQTRTGTTPETIGQLTEVQVPLSEKVEEYIFRLGCTSAHTLAVIVQLLSVGKIRLDFKEYNERLQLVNPADMMSRSEAMLFTENLLEGVRPGLEPGADLDLTQKVIIQAPKRTVL